MNKKSGAGKSNNADNKSIDPIPVGAAEVTQTANNLAAALENAMGGAMYSDKEYYASERLIAELVMIGQYSSQMSNSVEIVNMIDNLLSDGADPNYESTGGLTPLSIAIRFGNVHAAMHLIVNGADINISPSSKTCAELALMFCRPVLTNALGMRILDIESLTALAKAINIDPRSLTMDIAKSSDELLSACRLFFAMERQGIEVADDAINIFDQAIMEAAARKERGRSYDILAGFMNSSSIRQLNKAGSIEAVDQLRNRFPNFGHVIDQIVTEMSLSMLSSKQELFIRPILMVGDPGIGKTRFMQAVAKATNSEFKVIGCSSMTAGFVLSGSSPSWSEAKPGVVAQTLRDGKTGNPIIMLDEIDKLGGDHRFDGYGPLFQLLERETARNFTDEAIGVPIDCSYVSWIATANDLRSIPEPILSRFIVVDVKQHDIKDAPAIARSVYQGILEENSKTWGGRFDKELDDSVIYMIENLSPREMRKKLISAIGTAAKSRHEEVYSLMVSDVNPEAAVTKRRMGFCGG